MEIEFIEALARIQSDNGLAEVELTLDGQRIRLVRRACAADEPIPPRKRSSDKEPPSSHARTTLEPQAPDRHPVTAGLAGIFHRRPSPSEPPFIEEGARVVEGQTVAIIEAMKMLTEVEAPIAGRVLRIAAADGVGVASGDVLIVIEADAAHV